MKSLHVLLIGNGEPVSAKLLKKLAKQADKVIAADGGAHVSLQAGIMPDWVAGDLDSLPKRDWNTLHERVLNMVTQDNTDLEKSLLFITRALPVTQITLAGFLGGRWDFSLANILHLIPYAKKLQITLAGDNWRMHVLTRGAEFTCKLNKRVSLIPLMDCESVTLTGLKYPLQEESLPVGTTRSLSNQTTAKVFSVAFENGVLLVYREV